MPNKTGTTGALRRQVFRALVATFVVFYVVALMGVTMQSCQVRQQVRELRQEVAELQARNKELADELEYVRSAEYAEKVAREELKWSREGERVFVPVPVVVTPVPTVTPTPAAAPLPAMDIGSHWGEWIRFFLRRGADQPAP